MDRLLRLRKLKGFSQRALAQESGVSPATIYELENGRRDPNPSTLRKLARALEVEVADLLEEPEAPKAEAPPSQPSFENHLLEERRAEVKGPDESVWGTPQSRPDPVVEGMPAPSGERIHVQISETAEGTHVTITRTAFLDLFRKVRRGEISPEEAFEEFRRMSAA